MYRFPLVCLYFNKLKYILKTIFGCFKYQFTKGEIVFNIIELCIVYHCFFFTKRGRKYRETVPLLQYFSGTSAILLPD